MVSNKETLNEAYKEIAKLKKMMAQMNEALKGALNEQASANKDIDMVKNSINDASNKKKPSTISREEIIKIVRDIITLSFINKLYGRNK